MSPFRLSSSHFPRNSNKFHLYKHYTLELNGGVKNLFNQFLRDLDKGMDRDASYIYGPALPRT